MNDRMVQKKRKSSLKRTCSISFCFLFFIFFKTAYAAQNHEELVYRISYLWFIPIGKCTITAQPYVLNKKDIRQLSLTYESPRWFSLIYKIKGKVNSYIDTKTLIPLRYEEFYSYSWHDDVNTVVIYDQERNKLYIDRNGEKETKDIFDNTMDPLSIFYFLRHYPWQDAENKIFNLNNHQNNYTLRISSRKPGKNRTDLKGKISDIDFEAQLKNIHGSRHLQKISMKTAYGNLTLHLKNY